MPVLHFCNLTLATNRYFIYPFILMLLKNDIMFDLVIETNLILSTVCMWKKITR